MSETKMAIRIPSANVYDAETGIVLQRGAYIEAPEDFFTKFGKTMQIPKKAFDPKRNIKITIDPDNWKQIKKTFAPAPPKAMAPLIKPSVQEPEKMGPNDAPQEKRPGMSTADGPTPGADKEKAEAPAPPPPPPPPPADEEEEKKPAPKKKTNVKRPGSGRRAKVKKG